MKFAFLTAALILGFSATVASATPISGSLSVTGHDSFDSTSITFAPSGTISGATGSFSTFAPIIVGGLEASYTVDMHSFTFASPDQLIFDIPGLLSFSITTLTDAVFNAGIPSITLKGTGLFTESGFDDTIGTFTLTSSTSGITSFEFDGTSAISPEPSSFLLLGTGLLGIAGAVKRRMA